MEVHVQEWPGVDEHGHADGTPTPVPWVLRPHVVDNEVRAWDVVVTAPPEPGHVYLGVDAYWADEDGCGPPVDLGSQYAAWAFHLLVR